MGPKDQEAPAWVGHLACLGDVRNLIALTSSVPWLLEIRLCMEVLAFSKAVWRASMYTVTCFAISDLLFWGEVAFQYCFYCTLVGSLYLAFKSEISTFHSLANTNALCSFWSLHSVLRGGEGIEQTYFWDYYTIFHWKTEKWLLH